MWEGRVICVCDYLSVLIPPECSELAEEQPPTRANPMRGSVDENLYYTQTPCRREDERERLITTGTKCPAISRHCSQQ